MVNELTLSDDEVVCSHAPQFWGHDSFWFLAAMQKAVYGLNGSCGNNGKSNMGNVFIAVAGCSDVEVLDAEVAGSDVPAVWTVAAGWAAAWSLGLS